MIIFGYLGIVFMGIILGLMGGGGAILTVPLLTYLFQIDALQAVTYSLFVVGISSSLGAFQQWRIGNVRWNMVLKFGIPSIIGVLITKKILVPLIPNHIAYLSGFEITKSNLTLILFAFLMISSSYAMIKKSKPRKETSTHVDNSQNFIVQGLLVGGVTGLLGAGGGFLIIPALIFIAGLHMKEAVASSLAIISINALIGFFSVAFQSSINWHLLVQVTAIAGLGIFGGTFLSQKISNEKLKPAFGWLVLSMGIFILFKEIFNH